MKKFLKFLPLLFCLGAYAQVVGGTSYSSSSLTGTTQLIAVPSSVNGLQRRIVVMAYTIQIQQGGSPASWGLISGTGSNCGTNTASVTPAYTGYASIQQSIGQAVTFSLPPGTALCFYSSGTVTGAVVNVIYQVQ